MCDQSTGLQRVSALKVSNCSTTARLLLSQQSAQGRRSSRVRSIARAVVYIEERFRQSVSLEDIARAACMSRFHFARVFRDEIGMSPMQYLRWRRVVEAERRLAEGQDSLVQVATDLGYFDHSHFCRSFRAATGLRPTQFIAEHLATA